MKKCFTIIMIRILLPFLAIFCISVYFYHKEKTEWKVEELNASMAHYSNLISASIDDVSKINGNSDDIEKLSRIINSLRNDERIYSIEVTDNNNTTLIKRTFESKKNDGIVENVSYKLNKNNKLVNIFKMHTKEIPGNSFFVREDPKEELAGNIIITANFHKDAYFLYSEVFIVGCFALLFMFGLLLMLLTIIDKAELLMTQISLLSMKGKEKNFIKTNSFGVNLIIFRIEERLNSLVSSFEAAAHESERKCKILIEENEVVNEKFNELSSEYRNHKMMMASVGHDLKNPVDVIQKTSELMTQLSNLSEQSLEWINRILRSSSEIDFFAKQLMDSSILSTNEKETEIDVLELAVKCSAKSRILHSHPDILIYPYFDFGIFNYIYVNAERVERIITNLIAISTVITNKGSISLNFNSFRGDSKDLLQININGESTEAISAIQNKAIKDFNNETYDIDKQKGIALRLYICKHLVQVMGGEVLINAPQDNKIEMKVSIPVSIHSKTSPVQDRLLKQIEKANFSLGIYIENKKINASYKSIFNTIGLNCRVYSCISDIEDHDVIIGFDILSNADSPLACLKSKSKRLIALETGKDYSPENCPKEINDILHRNIDPYELIKRTIKWGKDSKIDDIPRIGKSAPILSNLTSHLLTNISEHEDKALQDTSILLIESHIDHLNTMKELLEKDGANVDVSRNYNEAERSLIGRRYDIVITEYSLGDADKTGLDIAKNITNITQNKLTPIVCWTADREVIRNREVSKHFKSTMDKPTSYQKLIMQIMKLKTKNTVIKLC